MKQTTHANASVIIHPQRISLDSSATSLSNPALKSTIPLCVLPRSEENPAPRSATPITMLEAFPRKGTRSAANCAGALI